MQRRKFRVSGMSRFHGVSLVRVRVSSGTKNYHLGSRIAQGVYGPLAKPPPRQRVLGESPQKPKQFAEIVYRSRLKKRAKF